MAFTQQSVAVVFHFVRRVVDPAGQGLLPNGQDQPQQVDLVSGCAGAAWRTGGGPTRRETLEESLGHVD